MERAEQGALLERHMMQASWSLSVLLHKHRDQVCKLAMSRAMGLGFDQYGDAMWHLRENRLFEETMAELADGVVYRVPHIARLAGDL